MRWQSPHATAREVRPDSAVCASHFPYTRADIRTHVGRGRSVMWCVMECRALSLTITPRSLLSPVPGGAHDGVHLTCSYLNVELPVLAGVLSMTMTGVI